MALEDTYFSMAEKCTQNVLIIADRGVMDASAFIAKEAWDRILNKLNLEEIEISDNRYNHVVHLQSAAIGAEKFYTIEDHSARFEGIELARDRDRKAMEAWRDHPYVDIIDNRSDFDSKINRLIDLVVKRIGIDVGDRWALNNIFMKTVKEWVVIMSVFSLDFGQILEKSSLLCLACVLIPPSPSSLQTSRFVMIIVFSHDTIIITNWLTGCPPLSALSQERFPIEVEETSQERSGHLHLHRP